MTLQEIDSNWTPPPELGYSGLRPVRLAPGGYAAIFFIGSLLLGGFLLGQLIWNQSNRQTANRERLAREGVPATATIERLWRSDDKEQSPRMKYTFSQDGAPWSNQCEVPANIWRKSRPGDPIAIRYVPSNPRISHPVDWPMPVTPMWVVAVVPLCFLTGSGFLAYVVQRQWRLLSEGRPAPAVITRSRNRRNRTILNYEFRMLNGSIRKGRCDSRRRLAEGELVCVLYDPENPRSSGIYPFHFVRLDQSRS